MRLALAYIRENRGLTQTQVSKLARISQGYYSDIESGLRCPSPIVADRIARVLQIPESDMFHVFYSGGTDCAYRKKNAQVM
jgi:transcriptional regulator with XRE-family HTH domain